MEDSAADLYLIREALAIANVHASVSVVHDGQQAIAFLDSADGTADSSPCPDLVLLDLNLPKRDGVEVLRHLRGSHRSRNALVLVVSSSDSMNDREAVHALGYSGYFRKPSAYTEFMKLGTIVRDLLKALPEAEN